MTQEIDRKDLEKELKQAAVREWQKVQVRKEKLNRTRSYYQRDIESALKRTEDLRRKYMVAPGLREMADKYERLLKPNESKRLHCPVCGEGDKGNKMNGKPWCFKCNVPLVSGMEKKLSATKIKVIRNPYRRELQRLNPGLYPVNEVRKNE